MEKNVIMPNILNPSNCCVNSGHVVVIRLHIVRGLIVDHGSCSALVLVSFRCTDQLQRWLESEPLDHISTLFLPSHTLVSTPLSTTYAPAAKTQDATIA